MLKMQFENQIVNKTKKQGFKTRTFHHPVRIV